MILTLTTATRTQFIDITARIQQAVDSRGVSSGVCMVFVPHTTAAVTINENADPDVPRDMDGLLDRLIPWSGGYRHVEGNSAAHMKATLVGASELVAIEQGRLVLGLWQSVFFCEFDGPRTRKVHLQFIPAMEKNHEAADNRRE
ncbi:MAG: secondary thiamine-phosphate synthase enzyme YjbQ [Thermodesulfobacteriota bacterium]